MSAPQRQLSTTVSPFATLPNGRAPLAPHRTEDHVQESFERRVTQLAGEKRPLQILELSGGGQNGAFGSGFLAGWAELGTRPRFDIVTGVSVGALISTWAFLGTPADDETLSNLWLKITAGDISESRSVLSLFRGADSFRSTAPLRKLINKLVTPEVLERVAAEHDKGRHLYIATANIDYKQIWVWDMTRLAKEGGEGALELYRTILHAAPSAPVAFPPVEIDGSLFVDAGTRSNLLLAGVMARAGEHLDALEASGTAVVNHAHVYVIVDGRIGLRPQAPRKSLKELGAQTVSMMMDSSSEASILQAFLVARMQGFDFNLIEIPQQFALKNSLDFDAVEMRELYATGLELGRQANPWSRLPPASGQVTDWLLETLDRTLKPEN